MPGRSSTATTLLQFASEEAKHIHLFISFRIEFATGFGMTCPVIGPEDIVSLFNGLAWRHPEEVSSEIRPVRINGYPGVIVVREDGPMTLAFQPGEGGKLAGVYVVRNPDKLAHLGLGD